MPSRPVQSIDDIPTITHLYATNRLTPVSMSTPFCNPVFPASAEVNDRVSLIRADITTLPVDAIVNAAKNSLRGGAGTYPNGCETGQAVITGGHNLSARHVVHTVGPIFQDDATSAPVLRNCYLNSLKVAADNGCSSIAFSGISTGIYGYPSSRAAQVACDAVREYLDLDTTNQIQRVVFVTFLEKDVNAYNAVLP
ncbi:hypothetical protein ACHAQJ_004175 [Trichoderma viride]